MASFNSVILVGNLTRDVELRYTPKGTPIANGGLAVNRHWKTETGEEKEDVTFVDFAIFGKGGETFSQYTKKGASVLIAGYLKLESWETEANEKRQKLVVVVDTFQFLSGKKEA